MAHFSFILKYFENAYNTFSIKKCLFSSRLSVLFFISFIYLNSGTLVSAECIVAQQNSYCATFGGKCNCYDDLSKNKTYCEWYDSSGGGSCNVAGAPGTSGTYKAYICDFGEHACGGGGGGGSCNSIITPVWVRVVERGGPSGTIAWKPKDASVVLGDSQWSVDPFLGGGLDGAGNFRTYRAFSENVEIQNSADWTNPTKQFDLNKNKQGDGMYIYTGNIVGGQSVNWSNHFCPVGRAAKPNTRGQLETVSSQNSTGCGPISIDVDSRNGKCAAVAELDVDGCSGWARSMLPGNLFGFDSEGSEFPNFWAEKLRDMLNFVSTSSNPFNWVDLRFDEYWSLAYLAQDTTGCTSNTSKLTLTPPRGYRCVSTAFYGHNQADGSVSLMNNTATINYNSDGSCTIDSDMKSRGNLALFEIQKIPLLPPPTATIINPSLNKVNACQGESVYFGMTANSTPPSTVSKFELLARDVNWVGGGLWFQMMNGLGITGSARFWDNAGSGMNLSNIYSAPANTSLKAFLPGQDYYFAVNAYDNQVINLACSGNPMVNYNLITGWTYCGNPLYSSNPLLDFSVNRPWRKIHIVNNVAADPFNVTSSSNASGVRVNWSFWNYTNDDLQGFNLFRRNIDGTYTKVNATTIPRNNLGGASGFYSQFDTPTCYGGPVEYSIQPFTGYVDPVGFNTVSCNARNYTYYATCTPISTVNVKHASNTTLVTSDNMAYCNSNTADATANVGTFSLTGGSPVISGQSYPASNVIVSPGTYTFSSTFNSVANQEIKCIIVGANKYPAVSSVSPISLVAAGITDITVVTGPVINSESWIQVNGGSVGLNNTNFNNPGNTAIVSSTYKNGANVFTFRNNSLKVSQLGVIHSAGSTDLNPLVQTNRPFVEGNNASFAQLPGLVDIAKSRVGEILTTGTSRTLNASPQLGIFLSRNSGFSEDIADLRFSTLPPITFTNNVSDSTRKIPIVYSAGSITIAGDIKGLNPLVPSKPPIFYVNGDITIASNVQNLEGFYIAYGNITIQNNSATPSSEIPLNLKGSLIAKGSVLANRNIYLNTIPAYRGGVSPSEIFIFNPDVYFVKNVNKFSIINTYLKTYD